MYHIKIQRTDYKGLTTTTKAKLQDDLYSETKSFYDTLGKILRQEIKDGNEIIVLETEYDARGRKIKDIKPDGTFTKFEYVGFPETKQSKIFFPGQDQYTEFFYGSAEGATTVTTINQKGFMQKRYSDIYGNLIRVDIE